MGEASSLLEPDRKSAVKLMDSFKAFRSLVKKQFAESEKFDEKEAYRESKHDEGLLDLVVEYYRSAVAEMNIGQHEELTNWNLSLAFKGKGIIDSKALYANLRLLPDEDLLKLRMFNRFVGQEIFRVTADDLLASQRSVRRRNSNPYFERLQEQARDYARLLGFTSQSSLPRVVWPERDLELDLRQDLVDRLHIWLNGFRALPGIESAAKFFSHEGGHGEDYRHLFNEFFHLQRQFDSDDWKDFDENDNPYPHPLARIASYRKSILDLNTEFQDSEGNISMCYDYCRMKKNAIVDYIRVAEDSFMKVVNRLDDDYPVNDDFGHRVLHDRAKSLKHMLFPMRCLFYDELEEQRGMRESNDNTLDSYFDMSLGKSQSGVPEHYQHKFSLQELEPELRRDVVKLMKKMNSDPETFRDPGDKKFSANRIIDQIQNSSLDLTKSFAPQFDRACAMYEEKYKTDENNLSRRLARLFWMYTTALSKKETLQNACQQRLDNIQSMSQSYAKRAIGLKKVNLDNEDSYLKLEDSQLPLLASPEQMEDLYNTSRVVSRLADSHSEFEEQAKQIEQGMNAALDMLKESEAFIEKLVARIFPDERDRLDLLGATRKLIDLSYKAQTSLANVSKKALMLKRKKSKRLEKEIAKEAAEVNRLKGEVGETKERLKKILNEKRELVNQMRITENEKQNYQKRLRMIAVMTVNSIVLGEAPKES